MAGKRFRWNKRHGIYHDTWVSVERCNLDDFKNGEESDESPTGHGWRLCRWCKKHAAEMMRIQSGG